MKNKEAVEIFGTNGQDVKNLSLKRGSSQSSPYDQMNSLRIDKNYIKLSLVTIFVSFATLVAWYCNHQSLIGVDDANIYMVYMRNLADGHGFVYNIGGERVEGFTSLLWTLTGSVFFFFSAKPEFFLLLTNIILVSIALWKIVEFIDQSFNDARTITPVSLFFLGALFIIPGYFEWTVLSLMETGLWSALLIFTTLNLFRFDPSKSNQKNNIEFCILIFLLVICRPESILWCGLFLLMRAIKVYLKTTIKQSILSIMPGGLTFIASFGLLVLWRISYFGFPFPNTYYAKVSTDLIQNIKTGIFYLLKGFYNNPLVVLVLLSLPIVFWELRNKKTWYSFYPLFLCYVIVLLTIAIPLYTGGDHFGYTRFFQPTVPLILLGLCLTLKYFEASFNLLSRRLSYILAFVALVFCSFTPAHTIYRNLDYKSSPISIEWEITILSREKMRKLNQFFKESRHYPSQGVLVAGGKAFSYLGYTNDLLGLNNVEMAHKDKVKNTDVVKNHASFNSEVFFKQKPDIFWYGAHFLDNAIMPQNNVMSITKLESRIFKNIQLDPQFLVHYKPVIISHKGLAYSLKIFGSTEFLETIDSSIYTYEKIPVN